MKKVRLIQADGKYPNLALMKISTYHKRLGDNVNWYVAEDDRFDTDILYISKIFTFSQEPTDLPISECEIKRGGTGYDYTIKLPNEIESITELDYSLYPNIDYSIIFTTRGCVRKCPFCIVSKKEGMIHNIPICSLNPKGKHIKVLDNNFFANPTWRENIAKLREMKQPLEFNAGIDLRLLTKEQCEELAKCKIRSIHCAWDNYKDKDIILPKLKMLCDYIKPYKILCYVLVGFENKEIVATDIERVNTIWKMGVYPFAMGYINFDDPNWKKSQSVIDFCRWCNNRFIFKTTKWEDYSKSYRQKENKDQLSLFEE